MTDHNDLCFANFRLDVQNQQVWCGREAVLLTPKVFAVLRYLVEHPGQLVPRATLLEAVWPDAVVGDAVLTVGIAELRKVLGDDPQSPRFIETVHRRGYRFIGTVARSQYSRDSSSLPSSHNSGLRTQGSSTSAHRIPHAALVGREAELAQLRTWLDKVLEGERQLVFVTGEAGIGKTALVDTFLSGLITQDGSSLPSGPQQPAPTPWIGQGHCIEHFGTGEAYLPVFTALGQLSRASGRALLLDILLQYAPTWLVQMPALLDAATLEAVRQRVQGATHERMLREITEALEALTIAQPLILVLEDLHWSGDSTLDLLSFIGRRRHPARLLVLGTYRLADVVAREHPLQNLVQDLHRRGQCQEMPLEPLPKAAVEKYLTVTFPRHRLPDSLVEVLHRRTVGNPLFFIEVIHDWVRRDLLAEVAGEWQLQCAVEDAASTVPPSLHQLIEHQLEQLNWPDQQLLEAASVAGEEFSAAAIATAVGETLENVEDQCENLVRRAQVLKARGTVVWPDGTVASRYSFAHVLYAQVLYERMGAKRRVQLHQRIGQRLEVAYAMQADEVAVELAVHFERGREYQRAIQSLEQAARKALRRGAPREATHHLRTALRLLEFLPDTPERTRQELALQTILGRALMANKGYGSPEVEQAYTRAYSLCQQIGEFSQLVPILVGIAISHIVRGEFKMAYRISEELLRIVKADDDPRSWVSAQGITAVVSFYRGEFVSARLQLEQSLEFQNRHRLGSCDARDAQNSGVAHRCYLAWVLWILGFPEQALQQSREAVAYAQALNHPWDLAFALSFAASLHGFRREPQAAYEQAETVITLATEQEFPFWIAQAMFSHSRALLQQGRLAEGIPQLRELLQSERGEWRKSRPSAPLAVLAEAYGEAGQLENGLNLLAEALTTISNGDERWWEAEVYRLRGELLLAMQPSFPLPV